MSEFINAIKRVVAAMLAEEPKPRRGVVASVNPATMQARVKLASLTDPSGFQLTSWLPIVSPCMGGGWGLVAAPPVGAQVMVIPTDGDGNSSVLWGAHWSQPQPPPQGYAVGEIWLAHETGAVIKTTNLGGAVFGDQKGAWVQTDGNGQAGLSAPSGGMVAVLNDKTTYIQDGNGGYMWLDGAGTLHINGNVKISGTLTQNIPLPPAPPAPTPTPPTDVPVPFVGV